MAEAAEQSVERADNALQAEEETTELTERQDGELDPEVAPSTSYEAEGAR